jgi:hypothetical protein
MMFCYVADTKTFDCSRPRVERLIGEVSETFHVHAATVCAVSCVGGRVFATAGVSWWCLA